MRVSRQGRAAAKSGSQYEGHIEVALDTACYIRHDINGFAGRGPDDAAAYLALSKEPGYFLHSDKIVRNAMGLSWKIDVFLWHPEDFPDGCIGEVKSQHTGGSTEAKIFGEITAIELALRQNPRLKAFYAMFGDGFRQASVEWAISRASVSGGRLELFTEISHVSRFLRGASIRQAKQRALVIPFRQKKLAV